MSLDYSVRLGCVEDMRQAWPLFVEHREELTTNKALMQLAPDWDTYHALGEAGALMILMAYSGTRLVGYSVNIVSANLHYRDMIQCANDLLFIHPDFRATPLGLRLMKDTRMWAKAVGAKLMLWHAKPDSSLDRIMQRKRMKVQDIIYSETL